eukprot:192351-Pleurochrysis_carterae.AAC.1
MHGRKHMVCAGHPPCHPSGYLCAGLYWHPYRSPASPLASLPRSYALLGKYIHCMDKVELTSGSKSRSRRSLSNCSRCGFVSGTPAATVASSAPRAQTKSPRQARSRVGVRRTPERAQLPQAATARPGDASAGGAHDGGAEGGVGGDERDTRGDGGGAAHLDVGAARLGGDAGGGGAGGGEAEGEGGGEGGRDNDGDGDDGDDGDEEDVQGDVDAAVQRLEPLRDDAPSSVRAAPRRQAQAARHPLPLT